MTEALQRSVESIQTADFFDIAQNCPKDEVQNCYSYVDTDMQNAVDMDAHTESCRYILIYTMRYIHIHDAFTRTVLWIAQIPHPPQLNLELRQPRLPFVKSSFPTKTSYLNGSNSM